MEDKQLNFNQPLLSVRRGSSSTTSTEVDRRRSRESFPELPPLPSYMSDMKSGPIRNAGVVPFQWEQSPGRPKGERKPRPKVPAQHPLAPKLPPGRTINHIQKPPENSPRDSPGSKTEPENDACSFSDTSSVDKDAMQHERSRDELEEKNASSSADEESTYLDALDTLSRTDSSFVNCSLSGVSGLDGPEKKTVGTFSDPPRDFMMERFLPAAKAVASETPHFVSRKQPSPKQSPAAREQACEKKVVIRDKHCPLYDHPHHTLNHYTQDEGESEEDDEGENFDGTGQLSANLCGLLPRFCLLNPVPGIKDQGRRPSSIVHGLKKSPLFRAVCSKIENKGSTAGYEQRPKALSQRSRMANRINHLKYEENKNIRGGDSVERSSKSNFMTLQRNAFHEERGFTGSTEDRGSWDNKVAANEKSYKRFQQRLAYKGDKEPGPAYSAVEKTLYVDTAQMVEASDSNSCLPESRGLTDSNGSTPSVYSSIRDINGLRCAEKTKSRFINTNVDPLHYHDSLPKLNKEEQNQKPKCIQQGVDDNIDLDISECFMLGDNQLLEVGRGQPQKPDIPKDKDISLILPLPKSPSESWLSRALPYMTSRNSASKSCLGTQIHPAKQSPRAYPNDPKWESMGKGSSLHHRHLQFPAHGCGAWSVVKTRSKRILDFQF